MANENVFDRTSHEAHQLHANVSLQWIDNGIAFFVVTSSIKAAIDAYIDASIQLIKRTESGTWILSMHDISHPNVTLNPYFRSRLDEIARIIRHDDKIHRSAIILANTVMGRIFTVFGNLFSASARNTEQRYFNDREHALAWLRTFKDQVTGV